jgi:hypothetical protein
MLYFSKIGNTMTKKQGIWTDYDPEKVKGVDIEALKQDIRDQRKQDSHGRPAS